MKAEVLTYSRARGLFAGIDLSGSVIKQDKDETRVLLGKMVPFETLLNGKVPPPKAAEPFLAPVTKYPPPGPRQARLARPHPQRNSLLRHVRCWTLCSPRELLM